MTAGQIKGALLEYIVRRLLLNYGFIPVNPDGHYVFSQEGNGLFFVNGKGAAHDADTLMEPPIQMPFSYPSRLLFECKSYDKSIGLNVIRSALGLRYDINEFEIVTDETIELRKNNHRGNYAIADRKRYYYQVGVASVENFSKPAFEFAGNNKIPLLSMRWFLTDRICDLFQNINNSYIEAINEEVRNELYSFLKKKDDLNASGDILNFLDGDEVIGEILRYFNIVLSRSIVGLIETGDIIFLFENSENSFDFLNNVGFDTLIGRLHFRQNEENVWYLSLSEGEMGRRVEFKFFVPERIMKQWSSFQLDRNQALNIKEQYFSRIFLFRSKQHQNRNTVPFFLVNIDRDWLIEARARLNNNE